MARKDDDSSTRDRCDICGRTLGDDAVIQGFPDGSVVSLCAECASESGPRDETEPQEDIEGSDVTEEWTSPRDEHPTAPAPTLFEAEDFEVEDFEADSPEPIRPPVEDEPDDQGLVADRAARAEAELAAWASASPGDRERSDLDDEYDEEYDEQEVEEAALQLVAAIAEANMREDGQSLDMGAEESKAGPDAEAEEPATPVEAEAEVEPEAEAEEPAPPVEAEPEVEAEEPAPPVEAEPEPIESSGPGEETVTPQVGDRTKEELLVPLADLVALQNEMQSALAKLSSTLEHFVADMEIASGNAPDAKDLVRRLEDDLESTRERLRVAETLFPAAAMAAATATADSDLISRQAARAATPSDQLTPPPLPSPPPLPKPAGMAAGALVPPPLPRPAGVAAAAGAAITPPPLGTTPAPKAKTSPPVLPPQATETKTSAVRQPSVEDKAATEPTVVEDKAAAAPPSDASDATAVDDSGVLGAGMAAPAQKASAPEPSTPAPTAGPVAGATAAVQKLLRGRKSADQPETEPETGPEAKPEPVEAPGLTFKINEVQVAQRYFNESEFVKKLGEISRSIGKPQANVSRTRAGVAEAAITVFWDIVWYQYIVDLRKNLPDDVKRVTMAQEGMDLQDLEPRFTEKNATINNDGRLDASELEVRLLSDPEALIANLEVSSPEDRLAEDATEEIWDQRSAPEFRWD